MCVCVCALISFWAYISRAKITTTTTTAKVYLRRATFSPVLDHDITDNIYMLFPQSNRSTGKMFFVLFVHNILLVSAVLLR